MQADDTDDEDCLELKANGEAVTSLNYLSLDFKLFDGDFPVFNGALNINKKDVVGYKSDNEQFEWRPATMKHKVLENIYEEPADKIVIRAIYHPTAVTNELLSCIAKLDKPLTGFSRVTLVDWDTLDEKVSDTVVDQFTQNCRHLIKLKIDGKKLNTETDRLNKMDLVAKILDAQAEDKMQKLTFRGFKNRDREKKNELLEED